MAVYRRKWWSYIYFEFSLRIPFIDIHTRMFSESVERTVYDICKVYIKVWKWSWQFDLYKKRVF